jgi:ribosomal protein S18 acetylase RimI-like enzyme
MSAFAPSRGGLSRHTAQGTLSLRPAAGGPSEEAFLYLLFSSTRSPELRFIPLGEREREFLLQMQFRSMNATYRESFPKARYEIVELDRWPVGRIVTEVRPHCVHYVDIALLPDVQGMGIGGALLEAMLEEPRKLGLPARLKVLPYNFQALRLYRRLGFVKIADEAPHFLMEWQSRH